MQDRVSEPWFEKSDRFRVAATTGIVSALWLAVLPSEETRIPERDPSDFPDDE
jgi:hypothetical protein